MRLGYLLEKARGTFSKAKDCTREIWILLRLQCQ